MAVIYSITYPNLRDVADWLVEIHDRTLVSATPVDIDVPGSVRVDMPGSTKSFEPTIISSTAEFTMSIVNSAMESWIDDLVAADEFRYYTRIYRSGALIFAGWLMRDQIAYEDKDFPFSIELVATDMLSALDDYDYKAADGSPFIGDATLLQILTNALKPVYVAEMYSDLETFLATAVNYFETRQTMVNISN